MSVLCVVAADDMDELVHAVKHAIQQCGLQVSVFSTYHFCACFSSSDGEQVMLLTAVSYTLCEDTLEKVMLMDSCFVACIL